MSSGNAVSVDGLVEPGFEAVADAFRRNFSDNGDVGAGCCVYVDGRPVVDLWGGLADAETQRPWERDTPVLVFSTTKGITAICVLRLVERGVLGLDEPVARVWPEFAGNGKEAITLRQVMSHRAGLPVVDGTHTLEEVLFGDAVARALERQAPRWEPGSKHGYHVRTYGWLLQEIVRRADGRTIGGVLRDELAAPLGLELWLGLPADVETSGRVASIIGPPPPPTEEGRALLERIMGPGTPLGDALNGPSNLFAYDGRWNEPMFRAAEMPSSNGIATARAVARLYAATIGEVDGVRALDPATVADAAIVRSDDKDETIMLPTRFGTGFALPPMLGTACPDTAFGHPGAGGSLGFADPAHGVAFGYVMNQMQLGMTGDDRTVSLVSAVYESVD